MKNRKYYVITKSNLTLTKSGMLALLFGELPMRDSYEARLVELFDAFKRREREGTKPAKEGT